MRSSYKFSAAIISITAMMTLFLISCEAGIEPASRNNVYDPHGTNYGGNPPIVRLLTPTNGQTLPSYFQVRGEAADDLGLSNIHISVAGIVVSLPVSGTNAVWSNTFNSIALGDTAIEVYSEDFGGNKSAKTSVSVYIDASLPSIQINYPTEGMITRITPVTLVGYSTISSPYAITNVGIETNGSGWFAPSGNMNDWNYSAAISEGTNTFRARAIATSLRTNTTAAIHVILDTTPPTNALYGLTNYQYCSYNFDFQGWVFDQYAGVSNLYLSLDGGPFVPVALTGGSNFLTNLDLSARLGLHTNCYYAVDNIGNVSATDTLIMDYTELMPHISILSPAGTIITNRSDITIIGTNTVGAFFSITNMKFRVNQGAWSDVGMTNLFLTQWTNQPALVSNATNIVEFAVYASSGLSSAASNIIVLDTTPPVVNVLTTPPPVTNSSSLDLSLSVTDPLAGVKTNFYQVNGAPSNGYNGASFTATGMTNGTNTISVWSVDLAGNASAPVVVTNIVDTVPSIFILGPLPYLLTNASPVLIYGTNAAGPFFPLTNMKVRTNGGAWAAIGMTNASETAWSNTTVLSPNATNTVVFVVYTAAGYSNAASIPVIYDATPPVVNVLTTPPAATNAPSIIYNVTVSDNLGGVRTNFYSVNGGVSNGYDGSSFTATGLVSNTNIAAVWAYDNAGNVSSIIFLTNAYDTNPPALAVTNPADYAVVGTAAVTVSGTASDAYTVQDIYLCTNGGTFRRVDPLAAWSTNIALVYGTNTVLTYARDGAGNTTPTNTVHIVRSSRVYVATNGCDTNSGLFPDRPLSNIQTALAVARGFSITDVLVQQGNYVPGAGLNPAGSGIVITNFPFKITGGWDALFASRGSYSVLDAMGSLYHVAAISNMGGGALDGFVMRGGNANTSGANGNGAGMLISSVSNMLFTNLTVSNNIALFGGGLYIGNCRNNLIFCDIMFNYATNSNTLGGGVYLSSVSSFYSNNTIGGNIGYNTSYLDGGGIFMNAYSCRVTANVFSNYCYDCGGGIYMKSANNNTISGPVMSNTSSNSGGGIAVCTSQNNDISGCVGYNCTISTNNGTGGGIYINQCFTNSVSGTVFCNTTRQGGGIEINYGTNIVVSGMVASNSASSLGGGICLYYCLSNSLIGPVISNGSSGSAGGGLYVWYSQFNMISNLIQNNYSVSSGTVTFDHASNNLISCVVSNNWSPRTVQLYTNCDNNYFSNCVFAGIPNSNTYIALFITNALGTRLTGSAFVSNGYGYFCTYYTNSAAYTVTNNVFWTNINRPSFTGLTADSTNNVKQ